MDRKYQQARIDDIIDLFTLNPHLFETAYIPEIKAKGMSRVVATLPLRHHSVYENTILFINEKLDEEGNIIEYRYGWEYAQNQRRYLSKQAKHIIAFDKQEHPEPPHKVDTDPYHHHHVPGKLGKRKETNVHSLEDVVGILSDYIAGDLRYNENDSF